MSLDADLLHRLTRMATARRRPVAAAAATAGLECVGLRDYAPGDDLRYVDWTRCARRDELLTRQFAGLVDPHGYMLLDCSRSMGFAGGRKWHRAQRIAVAVGLQSLDDGQCLGLVAFADRVMGEALGLRGRRRWPLLIHALDDLAVGGHDTDLAAATAAFARRRQRRGPVTVISDLYDRRGFGAALGALKDAGYAPRLVHLYDPREAECTLRGEVELYDIESGAARRAVITERVAAAYRRRHAAFLADVRAFCARHGIDCWQWSSDAVEDDVLSELFAPAVSAAVPVGREAAAR